MTFTFNGPTAPGLYVSIVGAIVISETYRALTDSSREILWILIAHEIADFCVYAIFAKNEENTNNSRSNAKCYALTNTFVNVGTLFLLRKHQVIAKIGTLVFIALMLLDLTCKYADFRKYRHLSTV